MTGLWRSLAALVLLSLGLCAPARAHTPDISTAKIVAQKDGVYVVDEGFLATDLERMFQDSMNERVGVDLSAPGVLESEIGRFVQKRVAMRAGAGQPCTSHVDKAGEDPTNQDSALVVLRFSCPGGAEKVIYDATKLLAAQGPKGKQLVTLESPTNAGQTMLNQASPPLDLSQPLETKTQIMAKFLFAGVEHIITGYDHICFLIALILWAHRVWPVVKIVTAFTVSHSITLSLAALDIVSLPTTLTEAAIAASIVFVGVENFFSRKLDKRWMVAFLFGFIHGFGFASGLKELGVPRDAVLPALFSFNAGVELGQLGIVLIFVPTLLYVDRHTSGKRHDKLVYAISGTIALLGVYWFFQRIGVLPG